MATKKLGKNIPGTSGQAVSQSNVAVLGNFSEAGDLISFIGPGGKPFYIGSSGVNQLVAGTGIAVTPSTGVGIVTVNNTISPGVQSIALSVPAPLQVVGSPITSSGQFTVTLGAGQFPVQNVGAFSGQSNYFLNGTGTFSPVVATALPYVMLSSGPIASTNITFTDPSFVYYENDETRVTVTINGAVLTPVISYTLTGDTITVLDYLEANTQVEFISKSYNSSSNYDTLDIVLLNGNTTARTMNVGKVTQQQQPVNDNDLVRLIDLQQSVLFNFQAPVRLLATSSVGNTYTNNTGAGTATITGAIQLVIDGVTPIAGNRVLLIAQAAITGAVASASNGAYVVTSNTASGFVLTREAANIAYGNYYFVSGGLTQDSTSYVIATFGPFLVGTTPILFTQFFASPDAAVNSPLPCGTVALGSATRYAREDHVHALSISTMPASGGGALSYQASSGVFTFTPSAPPASFVSFFSAGTTGFTPNSLTGGAVTLAGTLNIANGGTGATTNSSARTALGVAASGANSDITALSGLTTPLSIIQGGTGTGTFTANQVVAVNSAGTSFAGISPGANGNVLTSNGTNWTSGSAPVSVFTGTWQNVTGSRSFGVQYTNSRSYPIAVSARTTCSGGSAISFFVGGVNVSNFSWQYNGCGSFGGGFAIVPPNTTYQLNSGQGLDFWVELF